MQADLPSFPLMQAQVFGVGVDLCHAPRVQALHARHGDRWVQRLLTPPEQAVFALRSQQSAQRGERYLASRFAAKEALAKALGSGIRGVMGFQAASILHDELGKPLVQTHGELTNLFQTQHLRAHLSLSDDQDWVMAYCLIEQLAGKF